MKQWTWLLFGITLFMGNTMARAEEGTFEMLGKVCGAEIEKLCPGVTIGGGRILACLERKKDELTPGCNQARVNAQKAYDEQEPAG